MERPGRNDPCHCGSGTKYKACCLSKDDAEERAARAAEAEKQKAAADQQTVEDDSADATSKPAPKRRSPLEGKSGFWGKEDRSGRTSGGKGGRNFGSGHR